MQRKMGWEKTMKVKACSATIAKASARAAGPAGGIALISDKGPGIQMPDITKGGR